MDNISFEIVCFCGRYYVRLHEDDADSEGLGAQIIASIPADPEEYQGMACRVVSVSPPY